MASVPVNDAGAAPPKRWAVFSSAALLLFPVWIFACCVSGWFGAPQRSTPVGGPDLGSVFILLEMVARWYLVGIALTIVAVVRREQPHWIRETALAIYGVSALLAMAVIVIWRVSTPPS